jgi:hypothetical protein
VKNPYFANKLNRRERKELALSKIFLLILAVIGLLVVIWLAWIRPANHKKAVDSYDQCVAAGNPVETSYPSVCVTPDGRHFTGPLQSQQQKPASPAPQATTQPPAATQQYLTITEWGVRLPLPANLNDMQYNYTKNSTYEGASFTFKRLVDIGICKTDVGVSMTRSTEKNQPPYDISNPQPVAQTGGYYYYLAYAGSPCYDSTNADQMKVVNTINNGNLIGAVKDLAPKLEAAQ